MVQKTVSRQAVRERAKSLGEGRMADPVTEMPIIDRTRDLQNAIADANGTREPIREAARQEVPLPVGAVRGRDGEVLQRNRKASINKFEIPDHLKDPDYDYNWKTEAILNMPDPSKYMGYLDVGWRPVMATGRWYGVLTPKVDDKGVAYYGPIRRDGMVLMERPMQLTLEAQEEERNAASRQMRSQLEGARMALPQGFSDQHNAVRFQNRQSVVQGPIPDKRQLISE